VLDAAVGLAVPRRLAVLVDILCDSQFHKLVVVFS
jgi:hypothetical protein